MTAPPPSANGTAEAAATDARVLASLARIARVEELRAKAWRVELSGGAWATLSDPELLPERMARAIKVAMVRSTPSAPTAGGAVAMDADAVIDSGYVLVAAFLRAWSYERPLPAVGSFEPLLDLASRDYAALQSACKDLQEDAFTDFSPSMEPASPFGAASD